MELRCENATVLLTILLTSAGTVSCITCYRQKEALTITLFCSYGCCLEDETTVCCGKALAGPLTLFASDLSGSAVIGLVVAFIITLCIVVALVCCCVKKHTQSRRVDTTTNVSIATVTSHPHQYPAVYSPSGLMTAAPSYTTYPTAIADYQTRPPYPPHVTSTSITTVM